MNVSERKVIEDKIISIKYSTAWYLFTVMVAMFLGGFKFYQGIMDGQAQIYSKLDTIDRRYQIDKVIQTNINQNQINYNVDSKNDRQQLNLRLLRIESIIRPAQ